MTEHLPRPRPRFELESELAPEEIVRRLRAYLAKNDHLRGVALPNRLELCCCRERQHLWSPQLVVDLAPREGGAKLEARFGPHPHVWGMFTAIYFALLIVSLLAGAFGYAQWSIGQPPVALWALPAALVLAGLTFGASFIGQGLGFEQMYELRATLTDIVEGSEV